MKKNKVVKKKTRAKKRSPKKSVKSVSSRPEWAHNDYYSIAASFLATTYADYTQEEFEIVDDVFWFVHCSELDVNRYLRKFFKRASENMDDVIVDSMIKELTFGSKLNFLKGSENPYYKNTAKYLRHINDIRNQLFHTRVAPIKLKYKGKLLRKREVRLGMIKDYNRASRLDLIQAEAILRSDEAALRIQEKELRAQKKALRVKKK